MRKYTLISAFAAIVLLVACKKTYESLTTPPPTQTETQATPTPVGSPLGTAVTKEIGPSGGSIASDDGKLELIVPGGAVANNTTFSIQPITNFCPGGLNAFRLSPDGMTFTNPVTLKFNYTDEDVNGSFAALFEIAYQGKDNIWYSLPSVEIDSVNKVISVQVTHFTDWANVQGLKINSNGINSLKVNEGVELTLQGNLQRGDDQLSDLSGILVKENLPFNAKWYVNDVYGGNSEVGEISISPGGDGKTVHYKAPARVPTPDVVTISAELTDFGGTWYAYYNKKKYTFNKVVLTKKIKILPDEKIYSFHYEQILDYACAYAGTFETDSVEMIIHVKNGVVTIHEADIVNHASYITNPTVDIGSGCTMTTKAGTRGPINITKGSGTVQSGIDDENEFVINLTNSGATSTGCTYKCPNVTTPTDPIDLIESIMQFNFKLTDDVQWLGTKEQGVYWILTPK